MEVQVNHCEALTGINLGSMLDPLNQISHEKCEYSCFQIFTSDSKVHFSLEPLVSNEIQSHPINTISYVFYASPGQFFHHLSNSYPSATSALLARASSLVTVWLL